MITLFFILIALFALVVGFLILIQNPKGGGLSGNIAGFSNQFMGVKQTNDVLEKGTWIFSGLIAVLCLFSSFFMTGSVQQKSVLDKINTNQSAPAPSQQPMPGTPVPASPLK